MHIVSIPENKGKEIAEKVSKSLDPDHNWYADFKSEDKHYVIFKNKVFHIDRTKEGYV